MTHKYVLRALICCLIVILTSIVFLHPARAGGEPKGVTVIFDGGAVVYFAECRISEFGKMRLGGDQESKSTAWSDCGGGTESLSRLNAKSIIGICAGNCK